MAENVSIALQITLVGMGLVFALICVLWGGMALLVRLSAGGEDQDAADAAPAQAPAGPPLVAAALGDADTDLHTQRMRAAVAAVAVAVARRRATPPIVSLPPTANVSPWQAVARSNRLRSRGRVR